MRIPKGIDADLERLPGVVKKLFVCFVFVCLCLFAVWIGTKIPDQDQEYGKRQRSSAVDDSISMREAGQQENIEIKPARKSDSYNLFRFLLYGSGYGWP